MYRQIAGDDEFRQPEEIEKRQLARSLRAYIGCTKSKPTDLNIDDAFERSPHRWSDVFHIYADFPYNEGIIDGLRQAKASLHSSMQSLRERWRAPYCDAMFLDGGFREIAIDARIACQDRFGVRVFSEQVGDAFIAYLDDLEQHAPKEHWQALGFVHGIDALANLPT